MTFEPKATRAEAYSAIDSERTYQAQKWGEGGESNIHVNLAENDRTIDEMALYVQGYATDLVQHCSHVSDPTEALNIMRKIAALCVGCMEAHGAPYREGFEVTGQVEANFEDTRIIEKMRESERAAQNDKIQITPKIRPDLELLLVNFHDGIEVQNIPEQWNRAQALSNAGLIGPLNVNIGYDTIIATLTDVGERLADQILLDRGTPV